MPEPQLVARTQARTLHPVAHADAVPAEFVAHKPGKQAFLFGDFGEEPTQDAVTATRAKAALCVGDPGRPDVFAGAAPELEVPTLAGLDGLESDLVKRSLYRAAGDVPDAVLEAELVGALVVEDSIGSGGGFVRGVR